MIVAGNKFIIIKSSFAMKTNMYLGASGRLFANARHARKHPTKAEQFLWERLRNSQTGYKFRRQHPILNYVVDFYCHSLKYVIEVDGSVHGEYTNDLEDKDKDVNLILNGIFIQRFTNNQVINDIEWVMEEIQKTISSLLKKHLSSLEDLEEETFH
jgi:very-short-patch-repair endonuclease